MRAVALAVATLALLATSPSPSIAAERWAWPVRGEVLNHYRNGGDPYAAGQHRGIDIGAPAGTAVIAATAGSVTFAGSAGSSGLTISMRTADGRFDLSYLHLSALSVRKDDQIAAGDRVGAVGISGTRSDPRPHLHFGVRDAAKQHSYVDPLTFLSPPGAPPQPEPPRAAPVPVFGPARPAPAPVTAPRPVSAPAPRLAPRRLPVPTRRPGPAARPSPARRPSPRRKPAPVPSARPRPLGRPLSAPRAAPARAPQAAPRRDPVRAPADKRSGQRSPTPVAGDGRPSAALGPASRAPATPEPAAPSVPARDIAAGAGGPDLGWLLACVGVAFAALLLAWPQAATRATAVARTTADALKRPLFGPR